MTIKSMLRATVKAAVATLLLALMPAGSAGEAASGSAMVTTVEALTGVSGTSVTERTVAGHIDTLASRLVLSIED